MIVIRRATADDAFSIGFLFFETIQISNVADYDPHQIDTWSSLGLDKSRWLKHIEDKLLVIAEIGSEIAGFAGTSNSGFIDFMYVLPRFQRKGVASTMLRYLTETAKKEGYKTMQTEASITGKPFFTSHGFVVQYAQEKLVNGVIFKNYVMEKIIC